MNHKKKLKIGIIGAMYLEIEHIKKNIKHLKNFSISGYKFYSGYINDIPIVINKSGIGKVCSSIATTLMIKKLSAKIIINVGLCGGFSKKLKIGDIIISKTVEYNDVNLQEFGYKKNQIPNYPNIFYSNKRMINLAKICLHHLKKKFHIGIVTSGDSFISNKKNYIKNQNLKKKILSIDMESASIAHTCYIFKTPFISIRSVSDYCDKHAKYNFQKNKNYSIKNYSKLIIYMIKFFKYF